MEQEGCNQPSQEYQTCARYLILSLQHPEFLGQEILKAYARTALAILCQQLQDRDTSSLSAALEILVLRFASQLCARETMAKEAIKPVRPEADAQLSAFNCSSSTSL